MKEIVEEYAAGLCSLAFSEGCEDELAEQAKAVKSLLTREYLHFLLDPGVPLETRLGCIDDAFGGKIHVYLVNFMKLMTERRLADEISESLGEFIAMYYEKAGIVRVKAESAFPLDDEQKKRLTEKLEKNTGARVEIEYVIDPALIGGMKLDFGNRRIDGSVRAKLHRVGEMLSDAAVN